MLLKALMCGLGIFIFIVFIDFKAERELNSCQTCCLTRDQIYTHSGSSSFFAGNSMVFWFAPDCNSLQHSPVELRSLKHSRYCVHVSFDAIPFMLTSPKLNTWVIVWAMAKIFSRPLFFLHPGWLIIINHIKEGISSSQQIFFKDSWAGSVTSQSHCSALHSKIRHVYRLDSACIMWIEFIKYFGWPN